MRLFALATVVAVLQLSGCAAVNYKAAMPDVSVNCVDTLAGMPGTPLRFPVEGEEPDEHEGYVEFAQLAHCYRPADGAAMPVALYKLESITPPAEVKVSVQLSTGGTFAASLDLLDADMRPLRRYGFDAFVRRGTNYALDVFLNPSDHAPAYLLLMPDAAHVGRKDVAVGSQGSATPILAGPVMFTYMSSMEVQTENPLLQGGKVRVVARPHRTAITAGK